MLVDSVLDKLVFYSFGHLLLSRGGFCFSFAIRTSWALQRGLDDLPASLCPKVDHRHCWLSRLVRRRYFVVSVSAVRGDLGDTWSSFRFVYLHGPPSSFAFSVLSIATAALFLIELSGNSFTSISMGSETFDIMITSVASFAYEGHERGLCFGDFGLRVLSPSMVVEQLLLAEMLAADVALVSIVLIYVF